MIPADSPDAPKYWMHETSGKLKPVVQKYLAGGSLNAGEFGLMVAYLRQWIDSPAWDQNPHADAASREKLAHLRSWIRAMHARPDLDRWISHAIEAGVDPL